MQSELVEKILLCVFVVWGIPVRWVAVYAWPYARFTLQWWICTDIYYELRPVIIPYLAGDTFVDFLQGDGRWAVFFDVLGIFMWHWILKSDPPDPRDRWGKRRKAIKKVFTRTRAKAPVPVRVGV